MYISWYKRLRFFADISKKLKKKYTILDNLRTITQEGDMKTIHMTPFFILWSILVGKIAEFWRRKV